FDWKPQSYKDVFYCNFFAAKSEIYEKYVTEMLIPAMNIMHKMPELFANSNYPKPLPQNLKDKWGFNHYTFHSFLCERMFTHFAYANNLNCMHY
ncbi:MAG TPA: hypothetical protein VN922_15640, partial [Bacteroidia bacterium]|nr:hypothetical protein [Bacteroidia bacterium]